MEKQINSLGELDLSSLTPADLKVRFTTGRDQSTGSGRLRKHSYRTGMMTPLGDIEISVWLAAAEYVVKQNGLEDEVEHLKLYSRFPLGRGSPMAQMEARVDVLDACLSQIYRDPHWVQFLPYNERYHPDLAVTVPLVCVITECCITEGKVPTAQIQSGIDGPTVPCPHCGRRSAFVVVEQKEGDGDAHEQHTEFSPAPGLS